TGVQTCALPIFGVGGRTLVLADDVPVRLGRHIVHGTDLVAAEGVADLLDDRLDVEPVRLVAEGGADLVGDGLGVHAVLLGACPEGCASVEVQVRVGDLPAVPADPDGLGGDAEGLGELRRGV